MARYRSSIDLGAFLGARYISFTEDGKTIPGIFIPTAINGIEVREDKRTKNANQSKLRAFINFVQRSYNAAFLTACKNKLVSTGETPTPYNVPAWQQCYTLPEERRLAIRAALKKVVIRDNPDLATMEDVKGNDLAAAISRLMPFSVGDSYLIEEQSAAAPPSYSSGPSAQSVGGYTPAQLPADDNVYHGPDENDLPF